MVKQLPQTLHGRRAIELFLWGKRQALPKDGLQCRWHGPFGWRLGHAPVILERIHVQLGWRIPSVFVERPVRAHNGQWMSLRPLLTARKIL